MVTGRAGLQSLMRPATYQLRVREDSRPQQPTEFIPREFMSALRAAAQAAPQATAPQAAEPQAAEPQAAPQQDAGGTPSATSARYDPSNPYVAEAMRLEEKYNLPKGVFLALIQQESGFNPNAVSKAGAYGLAQLMPGTASDMGVDPRDPMQNLEGGARYLAEQRKRFGGDLSLALAGYNAGPGAVIKAGNAIPNFPETQKYVAAVMRNAGYPMSPPKLADGGLIDLARKYADGGSVAGSAQVYDPAVIAAIAASIVEPQGYAEGGQAAPTSSEWDRYLPRDLPEGAYGSDERNPKNRLLNYQFLLNNGAIRITQPGSGVAPGNAINSSDPNEWSLVSAYNDLYPNSVTRGWASKPESYKPAIELLNRSGPLHDGKYRQILQSARDLGLRPDEVFMPEEETRGRGYADGGTATGVSSDDATPPDYSGQYNTVLSEKLETEFQSLIKQIGRQRDLADYDMRGAFAAGQLKPDGRGHLTSQFKKPNHPTFSQDSIWNGSDGYTGGHWRQDAKQSWSFTPSATNLNMHGIGGLRDYWDKQEAPAGNVLNMGRIPFAAGGYVQGYADGGSASGSASNSLADLYEKYFAEPTTRQRLPTYEEMGDNPVGYSSIYPPQYMSNQDPNVSPVASRALMSDAQRLGLLGRRGPVTGADLPAVEARGQRMMDNAMTVAGAANPIGIRAFHSSPHKFDQFNMSKIGTGAGEQVYGPGLYVSDSPAVSGRGGKYDREFTARELGKVRLDQDEGKILTMLGDGQSELNILRDLTKNGLSFDEASSLLNRVQSAKSNIYEVNLNTNLERLLDRNKPLSEQPQGVQKALTSGDIAKIQTFTPQDAGRYLAPNGAKMMNRYKDAGIDGIRYIDPSSRTMANPSIKKMPPDSFGNVYWEVKTGRPGGARWFDLEKNAQKHYDSLPLPRLNYVMFDDKLIELLRRYGLLGMVGGGAAAAGGKQAPSEEQTDYAQGGSVDSAPVYDPAVIAAIAASITEDNYA